ncbi:hypothetical protein POTOM_020486 [Populus tomentosa]|uniref:KIB1-4 beta-propeller domain-containing protein n=1 Tax=Populus tomentosa TaxID=118781 RepID=A0A8X8D0H4_POPTO|nr:hypothetical protein POTOM_020486 [Populus tomentosa]
MIEGSYQVKNIPEMQDMQIATCSHGCVLKSDLEKKTWIRSNRMKNHAFFVGPFGQIVSHSVKDSGIQGNKIYFTLPKDTVLYEYDISMGSVGASLPCSNVKDK